MTLYHTPHLALGGELSDDYIERSSVMAYNTFCLWIGDTLGWLLSFRVFFAATEKFPNGALDPSRWPLFSIDHRGRRSSCCSAFPAGRREGASPFCRSPPPTRRGSACASCSATSAARCRNRNYVMLLLGLFFISLMVGVRTGLWLYGATFFWQLTNDQISLFADRQLRRLSVRSVRGEAAARKARQALDRDVCAAALRDRPGGPARARLVRHIVGAIRRASCGS